MIENKDVGAGRGKKTFPVVAKLPNMGTHACCLARFFGAHTHALLRACMHADGGWSEGELRQSMLKFRGSSGHIRPSGVGCRNTTQTKLGANYADMSASSLKADYGCSYSDLTHILSPNTRHADSNLKQQADISYQHLVDSVAQVRQPPSLTACWRSQNLQSTPPRPLADIQHAPQERASRVIERSSQEWMKTVSRLEDDISRLRRLLADKDSELGVLALQKSKVGALVMVPSAPVYGH